jgi:hypothetical protein
VQREGQSLSDVRVVGAQLAGGGASGFALSGAVLSGVLQGGKKVQVRIESIAQAPDPKPATPENENDDVLLYTLQVEHDGGWTALCAEPNQALAIAGRWDLSAGKPGDGKKLSSAATEVTFACRDSAIGKCAERLGYKPWREATGPVSPDLLHQACVRAVRADYCGTGESLTRQGEQINFYDVLGIQKDERPWTFEAEWTPDGARCVDGTRLTRAPGAERSTVAEYVARTCGDKVQKGGKGCNSSRQSSDVILYTEYPPR